MIAKITSGGVGLDLRINPKLYEKIRDFVFVEKYIPDVKLLRVQDKLSSGRYSLEIIENEKIKKPDFDFNKGRGRLECWLGENVDLHDIVTVIEYCLEYARQSEGVYCLHGSAVSRDGRGILIIGSMSGLGKSTLAVNLCTRGGFKFIGDEKILIDKESRIVSGIKAVAYNKGLLQKSIGNKFENKSPAELRNLIKLEVQAVPVKLVVQPAIILEVEALEMERWPSSKAGFHLFEEMSRKIRGVSRRINKFSIPLDSIDTPSLASRRSNFARSFSRKAPFISLIGGLTPAIKQVIKLLD